MTSQFITDENWAKIKDKIPKTRGKSAINHRDFIEAICWVATNNGKWEQMPECFGNWQTVKNRYRRWISCGYIDEIVKLYVKYQKQQPK